MADDKKVVFSLELDTRALKKNAKEAEVALVDLVEKQKTLRKEQKTNTVEYVQLTEEIRINHLPFLYILIDSTFVSPPIY
jgi:hypothetical protein